MRIGIIIGSTRPGRKGEIVAQWAHGIATKRDDADYELIDLAEFDLPLLSEPTVPGRANRQYDVEQTRAWSKTIDEYDGFVFVTPEYNHGVPAAMKNALDVLAPEWRNKAVTFVGYGASGGVRAVEQWRQIVANVYLYATRAQVTLSMFDDFTDGVFTPMSRREAEMGGALDELVPLARAIATLRG